MALILDSADVRDAAEAAALGYVSGITTNPALLKGADASVVLKELAAVIPDVPLFGQLTQIDSRHSARREADEIVSSVPGRAVVKIPSTPEMFALAAELADEDIPCAMTAIFTPSQAVVAVEAGARWVIPYVERTDRMGGDGLGTVSAMRRAIDAASGITRIMAGSIKSPEKAVEALEAGADDLTLPLSVLIAMGESSLSDEAISDFASAARASG